MSIHLCQRVMARQAPICAGILATKRWQPLRMILGCRHGCKNHATRFRHNKRSAKQASPREGAPYGEIVLDPYEDTESLMQSSKRIADHLEVWLNEEWTPLSVHRDLATEAAKAYRKVRISGEDELGSVLLGITSSLLAFDFGETFTDAFEVSNKVAELLMLQDEREVCCMSKDDEERHARVEKQYTDA